MKTNYTLLVWLVIGFFLVSLISCKKEVFDTTIPQEEETTLPNDTGSAPTIDPCDTLDYKNDTKIIFDTKCATTGCHDGSTRQNDYRSLTNIQKDKDKILKQVYELESMPVAGSPQLTAFEKSTMKAWLDCGTIGEVIPVEKKTSWQSEIKPIVDSKCTSCHSPGGSGVGKGDFTKFSDFQASAKSGAVSAQAINSDKMPLGGPALSKAHKDLIKKWIDEGSNNN